jgi:hypothetical protein
MTSIDLPEATVALAVPAQVEAAIRHVRSEQRRAAVLLAGVAKYRWLSALYEHEARLWTLLGRHTAEPAYRRAAADAQITARTRAREYAEFAHTCTDRTEGAS